LREGSGLLDNKIYICVHVPFFNSQSETEQSGRRFADEACSVFEFGLFRDKDERTTCREGFQKKPEPSTEDHEGFNALGITQRFFIGHQ